MYKIYSLELKIRCGVRVYIYICVCIEGLQRDAKETNNPTCECTCAHTGRGDKVDEIQTSTVHLLYSHMPSLPEMCLPPLSPGK